MGVPRLYCNDMQYLMAADSFLKCDIPPPPLTPPPRLDSQGLKDCEDALIGGAAVFVAL